MFGLFKKKQVDPIESMLTFDDEGYARAVTEFFQRLDPATRAHILIAYQNLLPLLSAASSVAQQRNESFEIEGFITEASGRYSASQRAGDEIGSRRFAWFLFASLLARLEKLHRRTPTVAEPAAKIWCDLALEAPRLKTLLPSNVVWKPQEKDWFDLTKPDRELIASVINHVIPLPFAKLEFVKQFAKQNDVFYWPDTFRIAVP